MYQRFYGLSRTPFEISPDPKFFFGTPRHNEALASLCHGIDRRKGFIVVTGEVGTGKTLLGHCLLLSLMPRKIPFAYVFNPLLSILEFLQYTMDDMGIPVAGKGKGELLGELNRFLIARYQQNSTAVLIVDEAHLLSCELLEEIRLLTNLETAQQKLLQIVLLGQPELDRKLDSTELRQLKQRIALRCRLTPLSLAETREYIRRRLTLAGAGSRSETMFGPSVVESIQRYSGGIPRLVNLLCEAALISGFATRQTAVSREMVEEVATDLRLSGSDLRSDNETLQPIATV